MWRISSLPFSFGRPGRGEEEGGQKGGKGGREGERERRVTVRQEVRVMQPSTNKLDGTQHSCVGAHQSPSSPPIVLAEGGPHQSCQSDWSFR